MPSFLYADSPFSIREDLVEANRRTWKRIAEPGSWWTGAERVAIAEEVRHARSCEFCATRKSALSPTAVDGEHSSEDRLPAAAVDAVHRIVTDQSRLTAAYVQELASADISDGHYVELLGIVVAVVSIDSFHEALGLPLEALPEPLNGEADQYRPRGLSSDEAWVPMLAASKMDRAEKDLFRDMPNAPNVFRAMSLVPDAVRCLRDLGGAYYLAAPGVVDPGFNAGRAINRAQMELIAARVSALNECFY